AYGHGVDLVAPALFAAGWREFCVATIPEALQLRSLLGDEAEILAWLYGPTTDLDEAVRAGLATGVPAVDSRRRPAPAAERPGPPRDRHRAGTQRAGPGCARARLRMAAPGR